MAHLERVSQTLQCLDGADDGSAGRGCRIGAGRAAPRPAKLFDGQSGAELVCEMDGLLERNRGLDWLSAGETEARC